MRGANPSVGLSSRHLRLPSLAQAPERALVAANALSLSRGVMAVGIFAMSAAGASPLAVLAVASVMWLTDALDGKVARWGWKRGATPRTDGAALDPLMDDLAFVAGFLALLNVGVVPLWFVAGLLGARILFSLIRLVGLAHRERFAKSQPITKLSGAVLAIGQLVLLADVTFPETPVGGDALIPTVIAVMTLTTAYSVAWFVGKHSRVLTRLLTP